MPDERRLAAAVLADDRDPLARAIARSTPSSARVRPGRRGRGPRARGSVTRRLRPRRAAGSRPRGGQRPAEPHPRRRLDAQLLETRIGEHLVGRAVERRSGRRRSTTIRLHSPSSRSVLCSATRSDVPVAASARSASPTSRVPAGSSCAVGSSRTTWRGRIARSEAIPTSCAWPPDSRCGSRSARASMPSSAIASRVRSTVSGTVSPRFIGPRAISSKTVAGDPRALGVRVLEADHDPLGELVERLARPPASPSIVRRRR